MKQRKPNRLKHYDYSQSGWYFVTICTQNHKHHFGKIKNGKMILNEFGIIVKKYWNEIPIHYPTVELDESVIMPNHIHGIIVIDNDNVGDENFYPLHKTDLSNIIKGFKIGVTKWCKDNNYPNFKWQRSFYDIIIRNEEELYNIRKYILQNPLNWSLEKDILNLDI